MSWGQPLAGTDHGPELLQKCGLSSAIKKAGWRIVNNTNLSVDSPSHIQQLEDEKYCKETGALCHNASAVGAFLKKLALETEQAAKRGEFALTIGGDHSVALGSIFGLLKARPETGIIWVDAHADLNTPLTTETGNLHGCPVGMLMEEDSVRCRVPGFTWMKDGPRLSPDKIVYIGLRDVDW